MLVASLLTFASLIAAFNYYDLEAAKDMSKAMADQKKEAERLLKEELATKKPLRGYLHLYCKLQELEVAACSVHMSVSQAMKIVERFPRHEFARVQAIVSLHRIVIDLNNFHKMFKLLDENDTREVIHRLGYLNVWTSMQPDAFYKLDLR